MRTTSDNKLTLPQKIIDDLGIIPGKSEIEFIQDENGRWYLVRAISEIKNPGRFRTAHKIARLNLSSKQIMALSRNSHIHE